ncbi:MAG: hypothetical protein ACRD2E_11125 [Terriglobales bacterium]
MENTNITEEVTVMGHPVRFTYSNVPIEQIELDQSNPRIRYRLAMEQNGKGLEQVIMALPEVKELRKDIELTGGLRERVVLQQNGNGKYKALEGNCRMVCLQSLHGKSPDEDKWKTVPARILPKDTDEKQIAVLLLDWHVAGKITWQAHEKAGQVYRMLNELHMTMGEVAMYMRTSKSTVGRLESAYRMMADRYSKIDDEAYRENGEKKYSYFDEFFRQKELKEEYKRNPQFGDVFCRWVGEGRLFKGEDVRQLAGILRNPEARSKFESAKPPQAAVAEAMKLMEQTEPEIGSDFFKLLAKLKEACTSAAQVKEILRIRGDKVARKRVLDAYEALGDFMKLADALPEPKKSEK